MSDLAQALMVAIRCHARQVDKQGEPYLLHVLRVVEAVSDEAKVVAALHDVIEDGDVELSWLAVKCGLSLDEAHAVNLLTRPPQLSYSAYIAEIACNDGGGAIAREVKLADLRDNLSRVPSIPGLHASAARREWTREWGGLQERYEKAIAILGAA